MRTQGSPPAPSLVTPALPGIARHCPCSYLLLTSSAESLPPLACPAAAGGCWEDGSRRDSTRWLRAASPAVLG